MSTKAISRFLSALIYVITLSMASLIQADDPEHEHEHDHDHEHTTELLAYRAPDGAAARFSDPQRAQQHLEAVRELGCEAEMETAAGITTVSYTCLEWKPLEIADHELAEQWEAWLDASGFDTSHGHVDPELLEGPEVVEFRLTEWETAHTGDDDMADLIDRLSMIGCEVEQTEDGDHIDVTYRAPLWTDIHLADHETAEEWVTWLGEHGFEVQHEHDEEHEHDHE